MPKLGLTMTEGTVARWLKATGEAVKQGEILFEFESDKSLMEYECPADGVLAEILVSAGETVPCGTPVAALTTAGPAPKAVPPSSGAAQLGAPVNQPANQPTSFQSQPTSQSANQLTTHPLLATPAAKRLARELEVDLAVIAGRGPEGRIQRIDVELAATSGPPAEAAFKTGTPLAKRLAGELGVDWTQLSGSGPGGRVVKEDVLRALPASPASPPAFDAAPGESEVPVEVQPLAGVRGVIARRMSESAFTAPHVTLFTEADASNLVEARSQLKAELGDTIKISYNAMLVAIVARALREHPALNACLVGEEIHLYRDIHIALAVDTERGLLVPVIRQADQLDLVSIQQNADALIERALAGKSLPDDLTGGTFTITNLGMFEIDGFTPIINQPQAAILGVGRINPKPVAADERVVVRRMMTLSLSFDHRLVDGGPAARFVQRVKQLVERPFALAIPRDHGPSL
jgi:pyruvate dehydrogenase E2 component (dihydrolipoamide acetyltransferase)